MRVEKQIEKKRISIETSHADNAIDFTKQHILVMEIVSRIVYLLVPLILTILSLVLSIPSESSNPVILFLYNYYPWIMLVLLVALALIFEYNIFEYKNIYIRLSEDEVRKKIIAAEDGKKIKDLENELEHQMSLYSELFKEIATDNNNLHNLCQIICTYLLRHIDNNKKGSYSVSIYLKNNEYLWMPAHISKNSTAIPKLYRKKQDEVKVSDSNISEYYFCKCICGKVNTVNVIGTAKKIKSTFYFKNKEEKKKTQHNQYINLLVNISSTKSYLIEVIAHNSSTITAEKELLDFAGRLLSSYALILSMVDKVAQER
ncbi:MAG: hypothetical protein R3Y24_13060 [Eubacteriales bacterium]